MKRPDFGRAFEDENERAELERWRTASDAERGRAIVELMNHAERVVKSTGIRNDEPARAIPNPHKPSHGKRRGRRD